MASVTMYEIRKMQEQGRDIIAKEDTKRKQIDNHVITEEEIAIEKLNRAMNDYLQDQETASQMEEAITYAVKILAGMVEEREE